MISAVTATAAKAAVSLFVKGVMLAIAIYTAGRRNGTDKRDERKHPQSNS